jgi:hypothetical protein
MDMHPGIAQRRDATGEGPFRRRQVLVVEFPFKKHMPIINLNPEDVQRPTRPNIGHRQRTIRRGQSYRSASIATSARINTETTTPSNVHHDTPDTPPDRPATSSATWPWYPCWPQAMSSNHTDLPSGSSYLPQSAAS